MADFELAVTKTIDNEGGDKYTEIKDDNGGATKYGISLRFLDNLQLKTLTINDDDFNVIQSILSNGKTTKETVKNLTLEQATVLYKHFFWKSNRYDEINDQFIAEKVFDMAVLMGASEANKIIQSYFSLKEDGIIGEMTIGSINSSVYEFGDNHIPMSFSYKFSKHFISICNKDKTQEQFLLGWLNRVMS